MANAGKPAHCPDGHDEKFWVHLVGEPCHPATHEDLDRAWRAAHAWLGGVVDASFSSTLGQVHLPSSTGVPIGVDASAVDPSQAYLVLARARRGDEPTDAIYIGLVGQTVTGPWRGLTGFYLPYCRECQALGERVEEILDWMPQEAVVLNPQRLPQAIRPSVGWFDDRMILGIKPNGLGATEAESSWRTWRPDIVTDETVAALVCCGPMMDGLSNIVFAEDPLSDMPGIRAAVAEQLTDPAAVPVVTVRLGATDVLLASVGGIRSGANGDGSHRATVRGPVSRTKIPADWGVLVVDSGGLDARHTPTISRTLEGTVRRLKSSAGVGGGGYSATMRYWPTGTGVVLWRHLEELRDSMAQ